MNGIYVVTHLREGTVWITDRKEGGGNSVTALRMSGTVAKAKPGRKLTVPDITMVREAVSDESKLSLLGILQDRIQGFLL